MRQRAGAELLYQIVEGHAWIRRGRAQGRQRETVQRRPAIQCATALDPVIEADVVRGLERVRGRAKIRDKQREEHEPTLANVTIGTDEASSARKAWERMRAIADGVFLARDLVNEPPNVMSPQEFATRARALSKAGVKVEVLGEDEMRQLGMN